MELNPGNSGGPPVDSSGRVHRHLAAATIGVPIIVATIRGRGEIHVPVTPMETN